MAAIYNEVPRLIVGITAKTASGQKLKVKGQKNPPAWLPGRNFLDKGYWEAVKNSAFIKGQIRAGHLRVSISEEVPNPQTPPTAAELADFTEGELHAALKDESVPVQWHKTLEAELTKRATSEAPNLPPTPAADSGALSGFTIEQALPLVATCTDPAKLADWHAGDSRKTLKRAIEKRLDDLEDLEAGGDGG